MSSSNGGLPQPKPVSAVCQAPGCDWERENENPRAIAAMVQFHKQMEGHNHFRIFEVKS